MSSNTSGSTDASEDSCYFCGGGAGVIEEHHIVPRRHGGSDKDENLVGLCPTCHERLERLYNKRFYDEIGVAEKKEQDEVVLEKITELSQTMWNSRIKRKFSGWDAIEDGFTRFLSSNKYDAEVCRACGLVTSPADGRCEHCQTEVDQ